MSTLLLAMACAQGDKPELVDELFAEYLDYDRLTADDITALSLKYTDAERTLITAFCDSFASDDFLGGDERDTLIKLGASAKTLSRHDTDSPWVKKFAPYLLTRWERADFPPEGRNELAQRMAQLDFKAMSPAGRLALARGIAEAAVQGEYKIRLNGVMLLNNMRSAGPIALGIIECGEIDIVDRFMTVGVFAGVDIDVRKAVLQRALDLATPGDFRWREFLRTGLTARNGYGNLTYMRDNWDTAYRIIAVAGDTAFTPSFQQNDGIGYNAVMTAFLLDRAEDIPGVLLKSGDSHCTSLAIDALRRRRTEKDYRVLAGILIAVGDGKLSCRVFSEEKQKTYHDWDAVIYYLNDIARRDGNAGMRMLMDMACGKTAEACSIAVRIQTIEAIGGSGRNDAIPEIEAEIARLKAEGGEADRSYWEMALAQLNGDPCAGVSRLMSVYCQNRRLPN